MMDSPLYVFQHTLLLFKDACPPTPDVYGGMPCATTDKPKRRYSECRACKYTMVHTHLHAFTAGAKGGRGGG